MSVDCVKVGEAFLPIPIPEGAATIGAATVGEVIGFHVAWPKSLILFAPEVYILLWFCTYQICLPYTTNQLILLLMGNVWLRLLQKNLA